MIDWTIVLVAAISAVGGPGLLIMITSRQRSREKAEDNRRADEVEERREERQDAVAARAEKVATQVERAAEKTAAVAVQTEKAAVLLVASNEKVAAVAAETHASVVRTAEDHKLEITKVHKLVNSGTIALMEIMLTEMETNLSLRKLGWNGHTPSEEERAAVDGQAARIATQKKNIEELKVASEFTQAAVDYRTARIEEPSE